MQIKSLTVQGFRSFDTPQTVDFSKLHPGLYHLSGRNEVEPELEGNGAGKSSLLEAVCWGLYGRTSRNLRAGAVKSWGSHEKCAVILEVQTVAHHLNILRVWNPNTLEVTTDGGKARPIDQKELDLLLGLSPEAFLFSIYFAQFAPAFIDLRPAEQMSVYSTVMGLNLWETAADAASRKAREVETRVQRLREDCARLEGQVKELEGLSFDADEQAWEKAQAERSAKTSRELGVITEQLKEARTRVAKHKKGSDEFRRLRDVVQERAKAVALAAAEARRLEQEVSSLTRKDLKNCPTCGQPITNKHITEELSRVRKAHAAAEHGSELALENHNAAMKEMVKFRDEEGKLLEAEKEASALSARRDTGQLLLRHLEQEQNPHTARRQETVAKLKALNEQAEQAVAALETAEAERGAMQFWSKGFKELRLSLIEESLAQLSIEANAALVELGLKAWALGFDVERETKSGGVSKGFTVAVETPHVGEPVPWEAWSGGESQRLRVAASLGFGDLICSRMGLSPNVELWDEPSTWLSEAGIHDLLSALETRAQRRGKIILLADHRALDFGGFAGTINVVKSKSGSKVTVQP